MYAVKKGPCCFAECMNLHNAFTITFDHPTARNMMYCCQFNHTSIHGLHLPLSNECVILTCTHVHIYIVHHLAKSCDLFGPYRSMVFFPGKIYEICNKCANIVTYFLIYIVAFKHACAP